MTTRGVTLAALLATLGRPDWWVLGLAGFLIRGGIVVFLLAIVVLPSPLALSGMVGPWIVPLALGRLVPEAALVLGLGAATALAWVLVGGWFAAATEIVLVRDAQAMARDEGLPTREARPAPRWLIGRVTVVHLVAQIPLAIITALAAGEIVGVAYVELTRPSDDGPLVGRVIAGSIESLAAIVAAWGLGEIVGGLAARRIILGGESIGGALRAAVAGAVRRPGGSLLAPLVTLIVLVLDLAALLAVVGIVWAEARQRLADPLSDPIATALTVATLGTGWCLALAVTGLIDAWRSVAMTVEEERAAAAREAPRPT